MKIRSLCYNVKIKSKIVNRRRTSLPEENISVVFMYSVVIFVEVSEPAIYYLKELIY